MGLRWLGLGLRWVRVGVGTRVISLIGSRWVEICVAYGVSNEGTSLRGCCTSLRGCCTSGTRVLHVWYERWTSGTTRFWRAGNCSYPPFASGNTPCPSGITSTCPVPHRHDSLRHVHRPLTTRPSSTTTRPTVGTHFSCVTK